MPYRTSWDYIYDICDTTPESSKPTFIENFLAEPQYVEKLNSLLSIVPQELEHCELCQAWTDIACFHVTISDFYECESDKYSTDLNNRVSELELKTRLQREAIEAEVDKRYLRNAFPALSGWEPTWPWDLEKEE